MFTLRGVSEETCSGKNNSVLILKEKTEIASKGGNKREHMKERDDLLVLYALTMELISDLMNGDPTTPQ